ncbi:helix-turn-helix domain-containing protein [Alteribacillus sp. HJP-4]|uniref:helix-turn-helix domain-containing protein n=1 Tax=Alteribacillus sp. HJP-4 TaxID=2775394 RepID=UPI0035CCD95D
MKKRTFGSYLYEMRLRNNLSLRDFGRKTGISYSYISMIEKDTKHPSREVVFALMDGLEGVVPEEMLRLAGYAPSEMKSEKPIHISEDVFAERMNELIGASEWTINTLAVRTKIDTKKLQRWLRLPAYRTFRGHGPDIISVYKLAKVLDVTPDYLAGFTDKKNAYFSSAPRPKNLREILATETLVFDHIPLDEDDKEKLAEIIVTVFDEK